MYRIMIFFIFLSCKDNKSSENQTYVSQKEQKLTRQPIDNLKNKDSVEFVNKKLLTEVRFCKEAKVILEVKETKNERIIKFEEIKLITPFEQDNANLFWKNSKPYLTNYPYGHLDYEFNEKEKGFMLFECNEKYSLLFLEVFSEEFPTFQKIKLNTINGSVKILGDYTISLKNFENISNLKQKEIEFCITKINNEDVLVSINDNEEIIGVYNQKL